MEVIYILLGFLSGSIMYSYLIPGWLKRIDIVSVSEDGNPGTANAMKYAGIPVGCLCLLCDLGKGYLPIRLFSPYADGNWLYGMILAAPVLGHAFSPWMKGKGGKGIAVTFGVLLGLLPNRYAVLLLAACYLFFSLIVIIRPNEVRTFWTFALFLGITLLWYPELSAGFAVISLTVAYRNVGIRSFPQAEWIFAGRQLFDTGFHLEEETWKGENGNKKRESHRAENNSGQITRTEIRR
ncbi:glycerol-3-phosphate acyltransferase [Acetivibrio sp. MSJd-27]|uniref:glycerol-3-phosphate acyltransferase n=1 Tax=Acetivibrio sp. MSJd-27 TaxID=2841523 RepID=UPI0015B2C239|nr:glycerol-3-phosphate acyltransferase [Acetivibrio sp. MSJd-27]MBU5450922.1 glycerol-3-phosphate acyltransferase [Acetivibrio sp. MSJd-27]